MMLFLDHEVLAMHRREERNLALHTGVRRLLHQPTDFAQDEPGDGRQRQLARLVEVRTAEVHDTRVALASTVERMLAHRSGMIGFPLRLLAREVVSGTAGFARSLVSGKRRVPAPPPMTMASVLRRRRESDSISAARLVLMAVRGLARVYFPETRHTGRADRSIVGRNDGQNRCPVYR